MQSVVEQVVVRVDAVLRPSKAVQFHKGIPARERTSHCGLGHFCPTVRAQLLISIIEREQLG
jgi:hypothetical protein